jgi:biotin synthase
MAVQGGGQAARLASLADEAIAGGGVTRANAEYLAALSIGDLPDLFRAATRIREHFFGNRVRCCSIVAAKVGRCGENCAFCSQSGHYHTSVKPAQLDRKQVLDAGASAAANGASAFGIVNSGYGPSDSEIEYWGQAIAGLHENRHLRTCASLGVVTLAQARRLKELGVERANHNLQTSRRHFPKIITTHTYDERKETLRSLKAAGIELCTGALFGMGETWADRIDLALELRDLSPAVVPLNFLITMEGTPLAGTTPLTAMECLHIIAVYRFILPRQEIKIAGGREVHLRDLQSWIFAAGASSFLIGNYLTSCGREPRQDLQMVKDLGLELETFCRPGGLAADEPATHAS